MADTLSTAGLPPPSTARIVETVVAEATADLEGFLARATPEQRDIYVAVVNSSLQQTGDLTTAQATGLNSVVAAEVTSRVAVASDQWLKDVGSFFDRLSNGSALKKAFAKIDPEAAAILDRISAGGSAATAIIDLVTGKDGADKRTIVAVLRFLSSGAAGDDVVKFAVVATNLYNLSQSLPKIGGPNSLTGSADSLNAISGLFSTGLFGKNLQAFSVDVAKYLSPASGIAKFLEKPNLANGLNLAAIAVSLLWRTPEGALASSAIAVGGSIVGASALIAKAALPAAKASDIFAAQVLGPIGIGLALISFAAALNDLIGNNTLTISTKVDVSNDGTNDTVEYLTGPDDWVYQVTNGTQTLPVSSAGFRIVAETAPAGSSLLRDMTPTQRGGANKVVDFIQPDGQTRTMDVRVVAGEDGNTGAIYSGGGRNSQSLSFFEDSQGRIWVSPPLGTGLTSAASIAGGGRPTFYRLDTTVNFAPINDARSLESGSVTKSVLLTTDQYSQLSATLGASSGILQQGDSRLGTLRPYLGSDTVSVVQEKKNEGYASYKDINGDGVRDRITNYALIKNQNQGDDTRRIELMDRRGRVWMEYAVDKNGNMAASGRAASAIAGGQVLTLNGTQFYGRVNPETQFDLLSGADRNQPREVGGGLGYYVKGSGQGTELAVDQSLTAGQFIASADGKTVFILQGDGNIVVYERRPSTGEITRVSWSSNTQGSGADRAILQGDGNLVAYAGNTAVWSSNTAGKGPARLIAQNDGNAVLYSITGNQALWSTNTVNAYSQGIETLVAGGYGQVLPASASSPAPSGVVTNAAAATPAQATPQVSAQQPAPAAPAFASLGAEITNGQLAANQYLLSTNGQYFAIMQTDGNLVVYRGTPANNQGALWSSGTAGMAAGGFAAMQGDGNLVVYAPGSAAKWASNTSAADVNRNFRLVMQDDGNLVIYDSKGGEALWSSQSGFLSVPEGNSVSLSSYDAFMAYIAAGSEAPTYGESASSVRAGALQLQSSATDSG